MKFVQSTVASALCLLLSVSAHANQHSIVIEPQELPNLHPMSALYRPAKRLAHGQPLLAKSNRYFRIGVQALNAGRYAEAIDDFSEVLSLRRNTAALIDRGFAYRSVGNQPAAIANYTAALAANPRSTNALVGRGSAYALIGQYDQAIADYDSALALEPANTDAHTGRAYVWAHRKQYERVGDEYLLVARQLSTSAQAYEKAGVWYAEAKRYDQAIAAYGEAIRLDPTVAASYVRRARAYRQAGDFAAAVADYGAAIRIDPANTAARWGRGLAFEGMGNYQAAADDYGAIERLSPHDHSAYVYRADDLVEVGRDDEARSEYEIASRMAPNDMELRYGRMQFSFYQHEYEAVISDTDAWLSAKPTNMEPEHYQHDMYYVLIWRHMAAQRLGLDDHAMLARAALQLDHRKWPYPIIAFYLGQTAEGDVRKEAAKADETTVRGQRCEMGAYLGEYAAANGREDVAKQEFGEALPLCPANFIERNFVRRGLATLDVLTTLR